MGTDWGLAVASTFVGVFLLPVLLFVVQSDCVSYYHYGRYLLGVIEPHELRFRRPVWYRLPQEEAFESKAQREDFLEGLPAKINTKEALSDWMVACLESKSPSLVEWALYKMEPSEMVRMPQRSRIMSLTRQHASRGDGLSRGMASKRLQENSAARIVLTKWAGLLGVALGGVLALKWARTIPLKKWAIGLGVAQVVGPSILFFLLFVTMAGAVAGGDNVRNMPGLIAGVQMLRAIGDLCIACLITGWAFVMWSLVARIKRSASFRVLLLWPVLIAILVNINMLIIV